MKKIMARWSGTTMTTMFTTAIMFGRPKTSIQQHTLGHLYIQRTKTRSHWEGEMGLDWTGHGIGTDRKGAQTHKHTNTLAFPHTMDQKKN